MKFKTLPDGKKIPVLGFGTWRIGGTEKKDTARDKKEILAIKTAVKLGITHIDTAEMYGNGHAEELVGEAIKSSDRKNLFITTKVKGDNLGYKNVLQAARKSLSRLNTKYIDLYLIHWYNPDIPLEETMAAMNELVDKGLVKRIGISNFSVNQMKEAQKLSKHKILANQIQYSLLVRNKGIWTSDMESKIIPYCQKNNITVIAYRPLNKGELTIPGITLLDEMSKKYKKTQAQIALNWVISKKNIITVFKASNVNHIKENLESIDFKLKSVDIKKLDNIENCA